ncbi:MAG TPA: penicillin-binding protein 2 [Motilibacterales bacterium]|nr:penicillin-binding protein 2 [Motilibacterales bacterium]
MTDRVHARLLILAVLVMSLVGTLAARAFSLQVVDADEARAAAEDNRSRELVIPAARGMVLDQQGRPLASNRLSLDVAVDRRELRRLDDGGTATLEGLADLLDVDAEVLDARLQNCGTPGAQNQPNCWNGAPGADPVVARDIGIEVAGQIMADPTAFPAVTIERAPLRQYPGQTLAAHALGHVGAITAEDVAQDPSLDGAPARGQAGLELVHDGALRGQPGLERVTVDSAGHRASAGVEIPAVPGKTLVTNFDAALQAVVEEQLQAAITRARGRIDPISEQPYEADGGAAVVLDVRTGAVLALASAPDFDANIWTGGIAADDYAALTDPAAGKPLLNRAVQTALAPASTFKVVSAAAALEAGYSTTASYDCPSSYSVGGRAFKNYRSRAHGPISLSRALEVSCDTVFYRLAHEQWRADGGSDPLADPQDLIATTAADFGFGTQTGIDLPDETAGRIASREGKAAQWEQRRDEWCARAGDGYPEVADAERARYLTRLAKENCAEGMLWRVGDALNASIGQGDTAATVLQVATAYAAIANGGALYQPQLARALLNSDGSVDREFAPKRVGTLEAPAKDLAFLRRALRGVIDSGTARGPFDGFPLEEVPLAGKTGTGEVFGSQATSWFASFAPADDPRYAVVIMVSQGGTGAGTSGASVKGIYEALFGVRNGTADPGQSVLVGGDVAAQLPTMGADGVPVAPAAP